MADLRRPDDGPADDVDGRLRRALAGLDGADARLERPPCSWPWRWPRPLPDDGGGELVARAALSGDDLPGANGAAGRADVRDEGGVLVLDVELDDLPASGDAAYYEVWLLAADASRLQPLGLIDGSGRYELPPGIDVDEYPLVDVSREPLDGDPSHGGDSVVRGVLATGADVRCTDPTSPAAPRQAASRARRRRRRRAGACRAGRVHGSGGGRTPSAIARSPGCASPSDAGAPGPAPRR